MNTMTQDTPAALRAALEAVRDTLRRENDKPGGPIWDTIWHTPHETLLDFIDGALAQAATSAAGGATGVDDFTKRLRNEIHEDRDALRVVLELIAIGESAAPARDAATVLVERGFWDAQLADAHCPALAAQSPDSGAGSDKVLAELHLLEEVCAIYANDEDRYNDGRGEAYGSVPVQVGFKARAARKRVMEREAAALAQQGAQNG